MKRLFDLILSILGLIFFSPLILMIVVLISVTSKGNVFYWQTRVGQNNKDFKIFKFRTMHVASDKIGLLTVGNNDPRVTNVGYFLRKYKIDELPQLFNVFIGEMSLVGPRPDIRGYYDQLEGESRRILELKPGLTSSAALKYANEEKLLSNQENPLKYNDTVIFPDKVKLNLDYYYNHTFWGDLKIISKTVIALIS